MRSTAKGKSQRAPKRLKGHAPVTSTVSDPRPGDDTPTLVTGTQSPPNPAASGPSEGAGFESLALPAKAVEKPPESGDLPEAYGTERLYLTARDPHWLYAHWDLTREQLERYNSLSTHHHLSLRVYKNSVQDQPLKEIHLHPESRSWFISAEEGTKYVGVLGYFDRENSRWVPIAISGETQTAADRPSPDATVRFQTVPPDVPLNEIKKSGSNSGASPDPSANLPRGFELAASNGPAEQWTPEQERALSELLRGYSVRSGQQDISSGEFPQPSSWSAAVTSVSSPMLKPEGEKPFWFNVNAELIIYGATDPNAQVTIGGRTIQLSSDGRFSFRFVLPDGESRLPVVATSADQSDTRKAELTIVRTTQYLGEVGQHPQDPNLKPPLTENVA